LTQVYFKRKIGEIFGIEDRGKEKKKSKKVEKNDLYDFVYHGSQ